MKLLKPEKLAGPVAVKAPTLKALATRPLAMLREPAKLLEPVNDELRVLAKIKLLAIFNEPAKELETTLF